MPWASCIGNSLALGADQEPNNLTTSRALAQMASDHYLVVKKSARLGEGSADRLALHRAGKADAERLRRELQ